MEINNINTCNNYIDPLVERFINPSPIPGVANGIWQISRGLVGTFLSPFSDQMGRMISGESTHRADLVAGYSPSIRGLHHKLLNQQAQVADLKATLADDVQTLSKAERLEVTRSLLQQKETLQEVKRAIIDRRCHVLAAMRGFFGDGVDLSSEEKQLMDDIEKAYTGCLEDFDRVSTSLDAIQKEQMRQEVWQEKLGTFLEVIPPTRANLEQRMKLAKNPWMQGGALAFLERHLGLYGTDAPAAQRAMRALDSMFNRTIGPQLKAGDLQQIIKSMEQSLEGKKDTNAKLASTLTALKALTAEACLEHPDELRRVLSLATFLFIGSMSGGADGLLAASFAKTAVDYFLSNLLPAAHPDKPESSFSKVLRVIEAGVLISSGGAAATGAYAAAEVAHYHLPQPMKPILVFGAAHFGLGLGAGAALGVTIVADLPHSSLSTLNKIRCAACLLKTPSQLPKAITSAIRSEVHGIHSAIAHQKWGEAAIRISAIALPVILLTLVLANIVVPFVASGIAVTTVLHGGLAASGLLTISALWAVLKLSEKKKKQAMLATLNHWRQDYECAFPDPTQRDAGVLVIYTKMEQRILEGKGVQRENFLELLKKHIPAFQEHSIKELDSALQEVTDTLNPDACMQRAIEVGE